VFEAYGTTSIGRSIRTVRLWISCFAPNRRIAAAQAFFRKALTASLPQWPRKVTLDGYPFSHQALRLLRREDPKWKYVLVRSCQYLNNIIEQDHRAIKTSLRLDDRLQVGSNCSHHTQRNRVGASDSKAAVLDITRARAGNFTIWSIGA
jgi:transposase-like protein